MPARSTFSTGPAPRISPRSTTSRACSNPELQGYYSYDPEGAERLLDEAGYPRGADGIRFTVPFDTHPGRDSSAERIRFTKVSVAAGISPSILMLPDPEEPFAEGHQSRERDWTFTPTFARIDADRYPDLLFVADFNRSQAFLNNGDGTFRNVTDTGVMIDDHGMGSAVADFDADGDLDWFVSSVYYGGEGQTPDPFRGNRLYRNDGGTFVDATDQAGVVDGGWGWAACAIDFENDGDLDIYHTNGWVGLGSTVEADYTADRSRAFVNAGDGTFTDRAGPLGLDDAELGRAAVCADFDNDGDVDILLLHEGATLWENESRGANFLRVQLRGLPPNTEAVGARITVTTTGAGDTRVRICVSSRWAATTCRKNRWCRCSVWAAKPSAT